VVVKEFRDKYAFLSNFHPCWIDFNYLGYRWSATSVEHVYQACKATDLPGVRWIMKARHAGHAKARGGDTVLRPDWDEIKDHIMEGAVRQKFQDRALAHLLLSTGDATLIEGNRWHDNYWGDCGCKKCAKIEGQNKLGKILVKIRSELKGVSP